MKRIWLIVACTAAIAAVCFVSTDIAGAVSPPKPPPVRRVTLVLAPYLTWDDLSPSTTPTLLRLAQSGAVGAINARGRVKIASGIPSPTESALGISSGAWSIPGKDALASFVATETYEGMGSAAAAYQRVYGSAIGSARIGYLGLPEVQQANDLEPTDAIIGTLGQAISDAGGLTAAVGNSDVGYAARDLRYERPAGAVPADYLGRVNAGDVSADLLVADDAAPYGRRTDMARFSAAFERVEQLARAHNGPSLVVLDSGDLTRAQDFASQATTSAAQAQREEALRTLDTVVGLAAEGAGDDELVIVVSQALSTDELGALQGLGPCVISGTGWNGYLTSASTHRSGLVTNLDLTATILEQLGIKRPVQVLGNGMLSTASSLSATARIAHLTRMNRVATSVDTAKAGVLNLYIGFAVLLLAISAVVLTRAHLWPTTIADRVATMLQGAVLLLLSVPISSWLMFVVLRYPSTPVIATLSFVGVFLLVWVASLLLWRFGPCVPVIALTALTSVVILAEQLVGAPLSFVNFFGYSPLPAARFYGMGNEAASILFGASIALVALVLDAWPHAMWSEWVRRWGVIVLGVVVVGFAAAPFLGANVGVAIWGTVGFAVAWMLMNGRRVTWKAIVLMLVGVVVIIGAFAAIDLLGGGEQTHLGRAITSADQGGIAQLWTIVVRKAETNMRVFMHTNWSWVLVAVLGFLGFMRLRPTGDFAETIAENPRFGDAITVTLAAGALAFFTEDSGIVIPALIMLFTGAGIVWLMLTRLRAHGAGQE